MKENTEYQILIGCHDSQLLDEVVSEDELRETVTRFFRQKNIPQKSCRMLVSAVDGT